MKYYYEVKYWYIKKHQPPEARGQNLGSGVLELKYQLDDLSTSNREAFYLIKDKVESENTDIILIELESINEKKN